MAITVFSQSWAVLGSQITCTIDSLSNGANRQSDEVNNLTTAFLDVHLMVVVRTQSSTISSAGTVEVYGYGQVGDAVPYRTDTATAVDGLIPNIPNARFIGAVQANSGSVTYPGGPFSVANAFGGILPSKWGIIVANRTGNVISNSGGVNALYFSGYWEKGV